MFSVFDSSSTDNKQTDMLPNRTITILFHHWYIWDAKAFCRQPHLPFFNHWVVNWKKANSKRQRNRCERIEWQPSILRESNLKHQLKNECSTLSAPLMEHWQGVLLSKNNNIWQRIKFIRQVSNAFAAPFIFPLLLFRIFFRFGSVGCLFCSFFP